MTFVRPLRPLHNTHYSAYWKGISRVLKDLSKETKVHDLLHFFSTRILKKISCFFCDLSTFSLFGWFRILELFKVCIKKQSLTIFTSTNVSSFEVWPSPDCHLNFTWPPTHHLNLPLTFINLNINLTIIWPSSDP